MPVTTFTTATPVKLALHDEAVNLIDLPEDLLTATIEGMSKVELCEAWHAVKGPEKIAADTAEELKELRDRIAAQADSIMSHEEFVTMNGNLRQRFTVSAYDRQLKEKVLDNIMVDPNTPEEVKERIAQLLAAEEFNTPIRKLAFKDLTAKQKRTGQK